MRTLFLTSCSVLLTFLTSAPLLADRVTLTGSDLVPAGPSVWMVPRLDLPSREPGSSILGPGARQDGTRLLRVLDGNQDINGFEGILYDNRDRGHSTLNAEDYPHLAFLSYGVDLVAEDLDQGLAGRIFLPHVVLGNSSMAMSQKPVQRSLPRLAMTEPFWRRVTPSLYLNNHLYVYPEHRDHDVEDRFPVNWPYMVVSQGSSGSDRAFLGALAMTLAAFPSDTFAVLREKRLVAPTLQMILRQNLTSVVSRADYLSGKAHPPAFDGRDISPGRMIAQAADMRPQNIPSLVSLRVVEEDFSMSAGLAGLSEKLLDSPAAIGRLWRGFAWQREMTVTIEDVVGPEGQSLSFEWRLLRGDPDLVEIKPLGSDGRTARIRVAWHDPWTEPATHKRTVFERRLSRVDIGVFAYNGVHDGAPAMISIDFPEHQVRQYDSMSDRPRLALIDYDARGREEYFDPLLYWSAPWSDTARYDKDGVLIGWDRTQATGETTFIPAAEATVSIEDPLVSEANPRVSVLRGGGD